RWSGSLSVGPKGWVAGAAEFLPSFGAEAAWDSLMKNQKEGGQGGSSHDSVTPMNRSRSFSRAALSVLFPGDARPPTRVERWHLSLKEGEAVSFVPETPAIGLLEVLVLMEAAQTG